METNSEKNKFQQDIDDLQFKVRALEEQNVRLRKDSESRLVAVTAKYEIANLLSAKKTIYDDLSPNAKQEIIKILIDMELRKQEGEFYLDNNGNLDVRRADGTSLISPSHQRITPGALLDSVLTQNKLLVESDDNPATGANKIDSKSQKLNTVLKELTKDAQTNWDAAIASPGM